MTTYDSTADIHHTLRRYSKETYKRDLQKRPTKETYKRDLHHLKETYKRDLQKRPTKKTYKRDLQKRPTKETYKRDLKMTNDSTAQLVSVNAFLMRPTSLTSHSKETCITQKRPTKETYKTD